jgi:hypothetical protein
MKKIKEIDFNNKEIVGTEYWFGFYQKERPEDWTIEDEIILLTLYLQGYIVGHDCGKPIHTIMDWRQNVSQTINKTLDKIEDEQIFRGIELSNFHESTGEYESHCTTKNFNGNKIDIIGISRNGFGVLTDEGKAELEKDSMLQKAKELAKAELLAEQETEKELLAEQEAEREANKIHIVRPIEGYYKHDQ